MLGPIPIIGIILGCMAFFVLSEMVFPAIWKNRTMLRFRIVQCIDPIPLRPTSQLPAYRLQYKHWPTSIFWSDIAGLRGFCPFTSHTMFLTQEKAEERAKKIANELSLQKLHEVISEFKVTKTGKST